MLTIARRLLAAAPLRSSARFVLLDTIANRAGVDTSPEAAERLLFLVLLELRSQVAFLRSTRRA